MNILELSGIRMAHHRGEPLRLPPEVLGDEERGRTFSLHVVTLVCGVLLCIHLLVRLLYGTIKDGIDATALGLVVVGLSPWIATMIKSLKFAGFEVDFHDVKEKIKEQGIEIQQIKFLLSHFLPEWEYQHLLNMASDKPFNVNLDQNTQAFEDELRHLREMGFIRQYKGNSIRDFVRNGDRSKDVKDYFSVTPSGYQLLDYRRDEVSRVQPSRLGSQAASLQNTPNE